MIYVKARISRRASTAASDPTHTHKQTEADGRLPPRQLQHAHTTHTNTRTHRPTGVYRRVRPNTHTQTKPDGRLPPRQPQPAHTPT